MFVKKLLGICTAAVMLFSASVSVCAVDNKLIDISST